MAYTTVNKSSDYFNTKLYTGTGSSQSITGVGFQPDFTWIKNRSGTAHHNLFDAVRGAGKLLYSNLTNAEATSSTHLTSFNSDGFSLGTATSSNGSGNNTVAWNWKANGQGSSNTDGSINTTYTSANTTAGFSIVKYTGTGSAATVGHGLGAVPQMIITKNLDESGSNQDWCVYHKDVGSNGAVFLNLTNTKDTHAKYFNDTNPTSSVFSIGTNLGTNGSGDNMIAYCFAEKTGYSKFGSYTGNGSTDGPMIYTGFKPAFIIIKKTSATQSWTMQDNKRNPINNGGDMTALKPNSNGAEEDEASHRIDYLSNGFKIRYNWEGNNQSGGTYIYMAFGQSIVGSNNIPATAR